MRATTSPTDPGGTGRALPGLDLELLSSYLDRERPGLRAGPLRASLITGGRSNLTYRVTDGQSRWVLRRPPLGHVLASAHDVGREYRVMSALDGGPVPVPRTVLHCADAAVIGAAFYLMEEVPGLPYRTAAQLGALGQARTRHLCERMVDVLVTLHSLSADSVGLADFGRPEGYVSRQVRRWKQQLDLSWSRDLPGMAELHARLVRDPPSSPGPALLHGDYRLDNLLVRGDEVTAVLDWEMSTLGDPFTDLALLLAYRGLSKLAPGSDGVPDAPLAPGYLSDDEMVQRYCAGTGHDPDRMGFYLGLAYFKLAVIHEGIHYRFVKGHAVGEDLDWVAPTVPLLVTAGLKAMET